MTYSQINQGKRVADEYEVSKQNKVWQIREYAVYDKEAVHGVLDSALIAAVAFVQDGQPVVVPMLFGRDGETIFLQAHARRASFDCLKTQEQRVLTSPMSMAWCTPARHSIHP